MQKQVALIMCLACLSGCTTGGKGVTGGAQKQVLQVRWQRLVDEKGQTCDRCSMTEKATQDAVRTLRRCLKPLNIAVVLEKTSLSRSEFAKDPQESNRICIAGKPMEEWLQARVGKSQCSGSCGDSECRTLTVDGKEYEGVPAELIVRAGLLAGAHLMGSEPANPWNPMAAWSLKPVCCPASPKPEH